MIPVNETLPTIGTCMRCGLCLAKCPTYQAGFNESLSPRARVGLLAACEKGDLSPKNISRLIGSCTGCLACTTVCPSGVEVETLISNAKNDNADLTPLWERMLLGKLLPSIRGFDRLAHVSRILHAIINVQPVKTSRNILPSRLQNLLTWIPQPSYHSMLKTQQVWPARGARNLRVGLFPGCAQRGFFAENIQATIDILTENNCEVVIPRGLECCGMPAAAHGSHKTAERLARHNIDVWNAANVDIIITFCATCGYFMKNYGQLLAGDDQYVEQAKVFTKKVKEISEFLIDSIDLNEDMEHEQLRVTYHDPCHLSRGQGITSQPRQLLKSIPGIEFIEMKEADWCCGGAGTYIINEYELSLSILDRKILHVREVDPQAVVTACPGCQIQLSLGIRRAGIPVTVLHPAQLLSRAYRRARKRKLTL